MNINKIVTGLLAALMLSWATAAYAVDNNTEFGIQDDLTVIGNEGTMLDPDVELKGFTLLGSTGAAQTVNIPQTPGNMYVSGYVQVSSGMYVAGSSTFTSGAYFTDISSFSDVSKVHYGGGEAGQVLKKVAGGGMQWANDGLGAGEISGTARRLVMFDPVDGTGGADSLLQQDANDLSITMMNASSMTILGNGTDGLGVTGATKLDGNTSILGANTFTVGTGLASLGGALNVDGDVDMNAKLNVDQEATFVSSVTALGNVQLGATPGTDKVTVNMAAADARADAALTVAGIATSGVYAAKFYSGADLAAWIKKK